jgi:3-oxoacyl-[acyl-carrier-protein] synthase-3
MAPDPATATDSQALSSIRDVIGIGSFTCIPGDRRREASSLRDFEEPLHSLGQDGDFGSLGCHSFREMSGPVENYVEDCIERALEDSGIESAAVDHIIFSTMDSTLRLLDSNFVARVLNTTGLVNCLPLLLSHRQCCSSMAALIYACQLFADRNVENVMVVAVDFISGDDNRILPFALFGDAVAACVVDRRPERGLRLAASSVGIDYAGLTGNDSFASRQEVAAGALGSAYREAGLQAEDVVRVFPCNLFKPFTLFNAAAVGIEEEKLHFSDTLREYGHCGNVDWMMNLVDYDESVGINDGDAFLALSSAPGFFACALLVASGQGDDLDDG